MSNTGAASPVRSTRTLGLKQYELNDHLGNVRAVVTDEKRATLTNGTPDVASFTPQLTAYYNYYPFGMLQPGRYGPGNGTFSPTGYRFGYNGQEKDNNGELGLTNYNYGARIYNPAIGKFLSVDPHFASYTDVSPYAYVVNNPIAAIDEDGRDVHLVIGSQPVGTTHIRLIPSKKIKDKLPATVEVNVYRLTVTDDVTGKTSNYFVTRDAPISDPSDPVDENILPTWLGGEKGFNVVNTSFEPRGDNKYKLVATAVDDIGAYALRTQSGSEVLPAEPNESPFREQKDEATGVQIHVGGAFKYKGKDMVSGSEGCFTCVLKGAANLERKKGGVGNRTMNRLVDDINQRKSANKKAGMGTSVDLVIKKRSDVKQKWTVNSKGKAKD